MTRGSGGLVGFAVENGLVGPDLAKVLLNGCEDGALSPGKFWPVAQHFTVAELRRGRSESTRSRSVSVMASRAFSGITVTYEHEP